MNADHAPSQQMSWADWAAVLGAALGAFMAILDVQITNASLREIQGTLGLDFSEGGWISTSYLIAEIAIIPLTGFLSTVFGLRRYIVTNCALFILASILCGCAWNLQSMICFRIFQGLVGGTLIPLAFQIVLSFMPDHKKPVGMAIFGLTATLAPTLGPSLGGWLTDNYGWRLNFFINILPGIVMIAAIRAGIPRSTMNLRKLKQMDIFGTLTLMTGLGCLTYMLEEGARNQWFDDPTIQICALVSLGSLSLFLVSQLLRENTLLDLGVFLNPNFGITAFITMITGAALYGGIYTLSMYLGQVQNYSASSIGQVMMWVGLPQLVILPFLPILMKHVNLKVLTVTGMILFAWSNFLNGHLDVDYAGEQFRWSLIVRAIGQPLFMIPLSTIGMATISSTEAGNASSIFNMMRNLGGSLGIALASSFVISKQGQHFSQYMEHLNTYTWGVTDRLGGLEIALRQQGLDAIAAKSQAMKMLVGLAQRDSFIQSFGDIFIVLSIGLSICAILVVFIHGAKADSTHYLVE